MSTPREGIIKLLQSSENLSLLDVVRDQYFQPAVQNLVPEILDYLFSSPIITQILDIMLSAKPPPEILMQNQSLVSTRDLKTVSDLLSKILTTKSNVIKSLVTTNKEICDYLNKFINDSTETTDYKISGYFSKIVKHLIYETNGTYVQKLSGLVSFLIHHLFILSYGKLLKSILRKFPNQFEHLFDDIIKQIILNGVNNRQKTFFSLLILKSLLKKPTRIQQFINPIAKLQNIRFLIVIASNSDLLLAKVDQAKESNSIGTEMSDQLTSKSQIKEGNQTMQTNQKIEVNLRLHNISISFQSFSSSCTCAAAEILKIIFENIDKIEDISEKESIKSTIIENEALFSSITDPHDVRLCYLIFLYKDRLTCNNSLIDSFFQGKTSTFVSNSILDCIRGLSDEDFKNFIEDEKIGIVNRLINYDINKSSKVNGHITELARILNDRKEQSPTFLSSQQWEKYIKDVFLPHIELVTSMYGGGYPETLDDSESDDEQLLNANQNKSNFSQSNPSYNQKVDPLNNFDFNYLNPTFASNSTQIGSYPTRTVIGSGAFSRNTPICINSDDEYSGSASASGSGSASASASASGSDDEAKSNVDEKTNISEDLSKKYEEDDESIDVKIIDLRVSEQVNDTVNQNQNFESNKEIFKTDLINHGDYRRRKRGTFPMPQSNTSSYLPNFSKIDYKPENISDDTKFSNESNNCTDDYDESDKIEDENGVAPTMSNQKANSYDSRFCNPNWVGISSTNNDNNELNSLSPLVKFHSSFCSSFTSGKSCSTDFNYIKSLSPSNAQSADEKLNNDKIPSFATAQPVFTRSRSLKRHIGNSASIDDVPPSLRKITSGNKITTNSPFHEPK